MAENFYTVITDTGLAKIANSQSTGKKVNLVEMAVGDGNGYYYNPTSKATALRNEVWRGPLNSIASDADNPNWIINETVIRASEGRFFVREAGLFDDEGDLIAIGKYPETYKPVLSEGSAKDLHIRMIIEVTNASSVTLKVDPSVIIATRQYVDEQALRIGPIEIQLFDLTQQLESLTYVAPTVVLTLIPNATVREYGDKITSMAIAATTTKKTQSIKKVELLRRASIIHTDYAPSVNGGTTTYTDTTAVEDTVTYTARVYDDKNSVENSKTVTFAYPMYAGVLTSANPTQSEIKGLSKLIKTKSNTAHAFTATNDRFVFAYPKSYGVLASVLDPNNFETISSYTRTEVSITGLDGTAQDYYVYTLSTPTTQTNFTNTYKY